MIHLRLTALIGACFLASAAASLSNNSSDVCYTAVEGDSCSSLADKFGVEEESLVKSDGATCGALVGLPVGTNVTVQNCKKACDESDVTPGDCAVPPPTPLPPAPTPSPANCFDYTVQGGDTCNSLEAHFGVVDYQITKSGVSCSLASLYAGDSLLICGCTQNCPTAPTPSIPTPAPKPTPATPEPQCGACQFGKGPCVTSGGVCGDYTCSTAIDPATGICPKLSNVCPCSTNYCDGTKDDGKAACCGNGCPRHRDE